MFGVRQCNVFICGFLVRSVFIVWEYSGGPEKDL